MRLTGLNIFLRQPTCLIEIISFWYDQSAILRLYVEMHALKSLRKKTQNENYFFRNLFAVTALQSSHLHNCSLGVFATRHYQVSGFKIQKKMSNYPLDTHARVRKLMQVCAKGEYYQIKQICNIR